MNFFITLIVLIHILAIIQSHRCPDHRSYPIRKWYISNVRTTPHTLLVEKTKLNLLIKFAKVVRKYWENYRICTLIMQERWASHRSLSKCISNKTIPISIANKNLDYSKTVTAIVMIILHHPPRKIINIIIYYLVCYRRRSWDCQHRYHGHQRNHTHRGWRHACSRGKLHGLLPYRSWS